MNTIFIDSRMLGGTDRWIERWIDRLGGRTILMVLCIYDSLGSKAD